MSEIKSLSVFVSDGDSAVGLAVVREWVKRGAKVAASTRNGTKGANIIRANGAVPTYTDLAREADIKSTLHMTKADVVIDLSGTLVNDAPYGKNSYDPAIVNNVPMLNACHAVNIGKLIYVSMGAAVGDTHGHPVDESAEISRGNDLFKAFARAESVLLNSDFNVTVLRAGYIYGDHSPALDHLAETLARGRAVPMGTGHASFISTLDLTSAILAVADAESLPNRLYHIADEHPISLDGFADKLGVALGVGHGTRLPILSELGMTELQSSLLAQSFALDNSRAKKELNWTPQFANQDAGIERMLMYWRAENVVTVAPVPASSALVKS
jgi:nucleoside-diphosphate-sugar epimerase